MRQGDAAGERREALHREHDQRVGEDAETIEGTPLSTSAAKRTRAPQRAVAVLGEVHAGADPDRQPDAQARPTRISVPTMALAIPPPGSPTGFGSSVKKASDERADAP